MTCTNADCENFTSAPIGFYRKRGDYMPKHLGDRLARYQCKARGVTFSNRTGQDDVRQHRPDINRLLPRLLCSGATPRRAAWILECSYNTVRACLPWLAQRAREAHEQALQSEDFKTSYIQFDEMQTFEHAAAKPLTIALAVRAKTGQILAAKVGRIPAKGHLATKGKLKYGWTTNEAHEVCKSVLGQAARVAKPGVTIGCDGGPTYPGYVASTFPEPLKPTVSAEPARGSAGGGFDPLFRLNHACAKIRADLACRARKTWATTKKRSHLQHRLDLYVAVNNGYRLT